MASKETKPKQDKEGLRDETRSLFERAADAIKKAVEESSGGAGKAARATSAEALRKRMKDAGVE